MTHSDYMAAAPHSAAINVTGSSKVGWTLTPSFKLVRCCILLASNAPLPTGFQVHLGIQQHHRSLAAYGGQRPQQHSPQRPERQRADPHLGRALRIRECQTLVLFPGADNRDAGLGFLLTSCSKFLSPHPTTWPTWRSSSWGCLQLECQRTLRWTTHETERWVVWSQA